MKQTNQVDQGYRRTDSSSKEVHNEWIEKEQRWKTEKRD